MKKFVTAVSLTIAAIGFAGLANAETWSPTGVVGLKNIGKIVVQKTIKLKCDLMGAAELDGSDASVGSLTLSKGFLGLCSKVKFNELPYTLVGNAAGDMVTMQAVKVDATTGSCAGDLTGAFDQSTGVITFIDAIIPKDSGPGDCHITGKVSTNPQASYIPMP